MATDAHGFLQYRERDGDSWYLAAQNVNIDRDYLLFAVSGKVRLDRLPQTMTHRLAPLAQAPKGLPADWERTLEDDPANDDALRAWVRHWHRYDGHSFTWLTYKEMCMVALAYLIGATEENHAPAHFLTTPPAPMMNRDWEALLRYAGVYEAHGCSVRLVLWYDN